MAYLLDANVFISSKRDWYRFATFPSFWVLLKQEGTAADRIESLACVRDELTAQEDDLSAWVETCDGTLFPTERTVETAVAAARVSVWASQPNRYRPDAIAEFLSRPDYWLVAYALAHGHTVVTHEKPSPASVTKIKIPDACDALGVLWCSTWQMLEEIGVSF